MTSFESWDKRLGETLSRTELDAIWAEFGLNSHELVTSLAHAKGDEWKRIVASFSRQHADYFVRQVAFLRHESVAEWRLTVALVILRLMEQSVQHAFDYAQIRQQGGRLIIEWPAHRAFLAELERDYQRVLRETLSALQEQPSVHEKISRVAQQLYDESAPIISRAMEAMGGIGYMQEVPIQHWWKQCLEFREWLKPSF